MSYFILYFFASVLNIAMSLIFFKERWVSYAARIDLQGNNIFLCCIMKW